MGGHGRKQRRDRGDLRARSQFPALQRRIDAVLRIIETEGHLRKQNERQLALFLRLAYLTDEEILGIMNREKLLAFEEQWMLDDTCPAATRLPHRATRKRRSGLQPQNRKVGTKS